jgi:hypothetical protein
MKNLVLKIAILTPLIPVVIFIVGLFILSYIQYVIMIFKVYSQLIMQ